MFDKVQKTLTVTSLRRLLKLDIQGIALLMLAIAVLVSCNDPPQPEAKEQRCVFEKSECPAPPTGLVKDTYRCYVYEAGHTLSCSYFLPDLSQAEMANFDITIRSSPNEAVIKYLEYVREVEDDYLASSSAKRKGYLEILKKDTEAFIYQIKEPGDFSKSKTFPYRNFVIDIYAASRTDPNPYIDYLEREAKKIIEKLGDTAKPPPLEPLNLEEAFAELNSAVEAIKSLKTAGASNRKIAETANRIVTEFVEPYNNIARNPRRYAQSKGGFLPDEWYEWSRLNINSYDMIAAWAFKNGYGFCDEIACATYYILHRAGIPCNLYFQNKVDPEVEAEPDHLMVIINMDENDIYDSRDWSDDILVVDPWEGNPLSKGGIFNGKELYERKRGLNSGLFKLVKETEKYTNPVPIEQRHMVWDIERKTWRCEKGYKRYKSPQGLFRDRCIPID